MAGIENFHLKHGQDQILVLTVLNLTSSFDNGPPIMIRQCLASPVGWIRGHLCMREGDLYQHQRCRHVCTTTEAMSELVAFCTNFRSKPGKHASWRLCPKDVELPESQGGGGEAGRSGWKVAEGLAS